MDWDFEAMVAYMASLTTEWRDEDKFVFLWVDQLILVHCDRERGRYTILSDIEESVKEDIYRWLRRGTIKPPEEEEDDV